MRALRVAEPKLILILILTLTLTRSSSQSGKVGKILGRVDQQVCAGGAIPIPSPRPRPSHSSNPRPSPKPIPTPNPNQVARDRSALSYEASELSFLEGELKKDMEDERAQEATLKEVCTHLDHMSLA